MSPQVGMAPAERDAMLGGIFAALDRCDIDRLAEAVITATGCDPRTEPDFGGITIAHCAVCSQRRAVTMLSVDGETPARICGDCAGLAA